ncbi:MAG: ArsR/SmtB family transcription factor [Myxococcales bacterium]|jgi:DNA-binding transcriptional ArsR family regulator|nr:winged helix-turn-helix domain-containing protein [Sphingomicrobium sp.]
MTDGPYIAEAASLIGDPARANMLTALLDGRSLTATELGLAARIAPSTASGHLSKLLEGKLLSVTATGRHRYYQLTSPAVARALESLMALAVEGPPRHRPKARCDEAMARVRTCYDHLAGKVGVALADALVERKYVVLTEGSGKVTDAGRTFFDELGVDLTPRRNSRRAFCRPCVDWSERRWHIGGAVGAAIATRCFELGWTARRPEGRALSITPAGAEAFEDLFGIRV